MTGKQLQKIISGQIPDKALSSVFEYLLLFGLGIVAILLHARLRIPLNIPGHHGLEFMAIIMAGRVASNVRWASSIASLGVGLVLLFPLFGFKDPFAGIHYMIPGLVIDLLYNYIKDYKWQLLWLAFISGTAYMMIPLSRLIIHFSTGFPYSSFIKHGYLYTLASFFIFGLAGGITGSGIIISIFNKFRK